MRFRFAEVTFDPDSRLLLRGPDPVHLTPKAFDLLELLLKERPRALSREELIAAIWPDVLVTESNLTSLVNDVRSAIGDDAKHPAFLKTHHGFGYSFAADVVAERAPDRGRSGVRLWLVWGLNVLYLSEGENVLGRDPEVDIWLGDPSVSRRHARILVKGETAELEDLGSKNGTYSGMDRIEGRVPLRDGDELRVGSVELVFHAASGTVSTRTVP
ncbi:MAG TPA: FHA domain-containing protein [Thermoanaerobaculia bacterium]|nr:FHA domain-containing protein [Thermoanaerobaculia bacterium]